MLIFSILFAFFGSFLFGYTTSSISGAIFFISQQFHLSPLQEGALVSIILFGAMVGSSFSAVFRNRRQALMWTGGIYVMGILLSTVDQFEILLLGRAINGIALGLSSMLVPTYLAEISPARYRGRIGSMNQIGMALGLLMAYLIDYFLSGSGNWQLMLGLGVIPALLLFIGMCFAIEAPITIQSDEKHGESFRLFDPQFRSLVLVGVLLSFAQQLTGINVVNYYSPLIFQKVGFNSPSSAAYASIGIGLMSVLAAFFAAWLIDKWGRIPLLSISLIGMAVTLGIFLTAYPFSSQLLPYFALITLPAYTAFFTIGMGTALWVYLSEMYPSSIRGKAMSLAVFVNWLSNYVISLIFPSLVNQWGVNGVFTFFACACLTMFFFIRKLPETKGKVLL
ncbi:MAG: MFS transporter [Parachlamydiaceae bacterium]